jgi:hypothetical protein
MPRESPRSNSLAFSITVSIEPRRRPSTVAIAVSGPTKRGSAHHRFARFGEERSPFCENRAWGTDAPPAAAPAPNPLRQEPAPRLAPGRGASHSNAPVDPLVSDPQRRTESIRENRTSNRKLQEPEKSGAYTAPGSRAYTPARAARALSRFATIASRPRYCRAAAIRPSRSIRTERVRGRVPDRSVGKGERREHDRQPPLLLPRPSGVVCHSWPQ